MLSVVVANRKGGTGKTTTAVNLAAEWARQGHNTLLIDLDTQGHSAIGIGCGEYQRNWRSIHQLFREQDKTLDELMMVTPLKNLSFIAADTHFDGLGLEWEMTLLRDKLFSDEMIRRFSRVVIDTPPSLDALLISGLSAANAVLVPFIPHHLAEVGVKQLAQLFYRVSTRYNNDLKLLGLLPVMLDKRMKSQKLILAQLTQRFGSDKILRGIRTNIRLAEAFSVGKPVRDYDPRCAGAMDYTLLSNELEVFFT